jgi:hypothetical protein
MEVQTMSIVRRTSPLGEMLSLRQAMDRLFAPTAESAGQAEAATGEEIDVRPVGATADAGS